MVGGLRMLSCQFLIPLDDLLFVYHKCLDFNPFADAVGSAPFTMNVLHHEI
jgi:hypothetical protein